MEERRAWLDVPSLAALLRSLNSVLPLGTAVRFGAPFHDSIEAFLENDGRRHGHDYEVLSDGSQLARLATLAEGLHDAPPFIELFVDGGETRLHGHDLDGGIRDILIVGDFSVPWAHELLQRFEPTVRDSLRHVPSRRGA